MHGQLRLYDYRCFRREAPATLDIAPGFTSFIGANNAGKTALLKALYELREPVRAVLRVLTYPGMTHALSGEGRFEPFDSSVPFPNYEDIVAERTDRSDGMMRADLIVGSSDSYEARRLRRISLVFGAASWGVEFYTEKDDLIAAKEVQHSHVYSTHTTERLVVMVAGERLEFDTRPMIEFLTTLTQTMYVGSFRNAINSGGGALPYFDVNVGSLFINTWHTWEHGSKAQRRALRDLVGQVEDMMGLNGLNITASPSNNTLLVETGGRQGKLSDVGSGIAHVLVTLAHAMISKPRLIAIDEPETGLHPALQRSFLEALGNVASHGVLFTTHSMGLARTEADRCYTVHRSGNDSIVRPYEKTAHLSEVLGSLGIAAIQDLTYTRLLLVEGQTDVRVFKRLLALYGLDRDTVVLSLGGSTLIRDGVAEEMAEVLRICPNTRVIFDSERPSPTSAPPKDRQRFAKICDDLGLLHCMTELRATDNYFTQPAIDAALGAGRAVRLGPFDKLVGQWGKADNWRIAAETRREDLDKTDIGRFLANWALLAVPVVA